MFYNTEDDKEQWAMKAFGRALGRCKFMGYEFTISLLDIPTPDYCPFLDVPLCYDLALARGTLSRLHMPALCRRDHSFGYTPANVFVASLRWNDLQGRWTLEKALDMYRKGLLLV